MKEIHIHSDEDLKLADEIFSALVSGETLSKETEDAAESAVLNLKFLKEYAHAVRFCSVTDEEE